MDRDSWRGGADHPGSEQRYLRGARALYKVRRRDTTEAVIGAITGRLGQPQTLVLGRYDDTGQLRAVGRSTPLCPDAVRELAGRLRPAGPGHAWEGVRFTTSWCSRKPLDVTLVEPGLVAEIAVDKLPMPRAIGSPSRHRRRPMSDQWQTYVNGSLLGAGMTHAAITGADGPSWPRRQSPLSQLLSPSPFRISSAIRQQRRLRECASGTTDGSC
nr:hypothetical protein [Streptomyces purpurogeneiscleroticus]